MSQDRDGFLARVKDRAGQFDAAVVEPAVRATLRTLGGHMGGVPPALHDALPRLLRAELAAGQDEHALRPAELYQRLAEQLGVRVGVALELVQSTMTELADAIGEPEIEVLRSSLPPAWAALILEAHDRERESSRPVRAAKVTEGSGMYRLSAEGSGAHKVTEGSGAHKVTEGSGAHKLTEGSGAHKLTEGSGAFKLSGGRPGSSRPLADAQPPAGQADSIAASDDPHDDRLATARGPGPHDDDRTLAGGRPGSRRSLADSD